VIRLSVNVNKVATLRNARGGSVPDVVRCAGIAIDAGCHGITVHPRPDGRHVREQDVLDLAALTAARGVEFNIEGYPSPQWLALVERVRPTQATLVPDPPEALTSNAGWELRREPAGLRDQLSSLRALGIRTSLFVDPDPDTVRAAAALGAGRVELYTEPYARAFPTPRRDEVYARYHRAAEAARDAGLGLNAGHDLDLRNLPYLAARLPGLAEVSIGHALISHALEVGLAATVRAFLRALEGSPQVSVRAAR
jgi:pyridoxine 5-phosphate synthase